MIYPKDFESKIGFSSLRGVIKEKCDTDMGRGLVDEMKFISNFQVLKRELGCVDEMKRLIASGLPLPQFSYFDVEAWLKECRSPGSYMSSQQLYQTALTFGTMKEIHQFFNREAGSGPKCDLLCKKFCEIPVEEELEREILRCIDRDFNVKDNASPELYEIRRSIESLSRSMHKIMRSVLDRSIGQGLIEKDVTPVIRDGRMVIPVMASNKKGISGIVHDTSATGKTVFIEPSEVVEAGNRLRELHGEEEQEIITILIRLTDELRPKYDEIISGCEKLSEYDFIKAKSLFAIEIGGEMPVIEKEPEIDWFHAVHPGLLLTLRQHGREVIAMNLALDKKKRILVISGPNAGGKSVALKTVGTIQYMTQCGLLPSLYSNSHVGVFNNIFIDIGDEQSMENDLSTYSSHLANMKYFLQNANSRTLILADEMGSGTEPQIGAALAQSILKVLGESGCFGVITTHYQNLKIFAENEEGFINGAMLYDRQKLRPTFQLSVGEPGSSFALEIAGNIGLPKSVTDAAKELVGSEYVDSERFLMDIQRDKRYWKNKRLEIKEKESRLNKLLEEYEDKADELKRQRTSILHDAKQEAKEILKGANTQIERSIHEIRKTQADKERAKEVRKELEEYKKTLEAESTSDSLPDALKPLKHKSRKKTQRTHEPAGNKELKESLKPGDFVKMESGGSVGTIISIEGKNAEVAFGNLRTKIAMSKLQAAKKPAEKKGPGLGVAITSSESAESRKRQLNFKNDIDVRGFRADEALQAITYFLDDAIQFNAQRVRILHGTGHGILRNLIREQLKSNPNVKSYGDEDVRFGGAGITVVDLS